ncbi:MAG TPA: ATP-binding protein [Syntrophales bacterium]|nr:ATP-binding protein [Syntrophales bacterium]
MDLQYFNPWWKDGRVPSLLLGKARKIFHEILASLDMRQMVVLTGLRRVGKTTLLYQTIDALLKRGVSPYHIFYFSFDEYRKDFYDLIKQYETQTLREDFAKTQVYIFLDEIQKHADWASKVKLLYDLNPSCKIFLSGSAQIMLWKNARESLAGRFFEFPVSPLDFEEYLLFRDVWVDSDREEIFEGEIKRHLQDYIESGGFIEALKLEGILRKRYFKESLMERVIFVDVPQTFRLDRPEVLLTIVNTAAAKPGLFLDIKNLSNDLKIDQRTLANYVNYLEYALFLQKLYNYSPNLLTTEKKMKRLYVSNAAFTLALNPGLDFSLLLEQFFVNMLGARFFVRTPQKEEIDIVLADEKRILPVEVKIQDQVNAREGRYLFRFLEKHNLKKALIISRDAETTFERNGMAIRVIPYWKYWSILKEL